MDNLIKDVRYGIRSLRKRPGFALIAIITLTLGIGANTAIFTLVDAVLLKSLPVNNPQELVLFSDSTGEGTSIVDTPKVGQWQRFSYSSYLYIRDHHHSFQDITGFRSGLSRLSVRDAELPGAGAQRASGHLVSGNYFSVLGVGAMRGRVLTPEDDKSGAPPVAVVSNRYWTQSMNSNTSIVGKSLVLNGTNFTIVGITPPEFFGERVRQSPDFWLPLAFHPQIELRDSFLTDNNAYWLMMMGRLKSGLPLEQAQADVNLALRQFLTEQAGSSLSDERRSAIENTYALLVPGAGGISGLRRIYSKPLHMLMAIVAMVLLIACANIGGLLLSRGAARRAEVSLRMALGATRLRIVRQLLTESLLLAIIGGVCGIFVSVWGVTLLVNLVAKDSPLNTKPDLMVLGFTVGVSMISGVLFGLVPAIRASKTDLASAMKAKTRNGGGRLRWSFSSALVVMQIGMSMVLLTGAGLFARSLLKLQNEDIGFEKANVLLVRIDPRLAGFKPADLSALYRQMLDRLSTLSGIRSVSLATYSPMGGSNRDSTISIPGYTPQKNENMDVQDLLIGPNYADSLGLSLLQGREIGSRDTPASQRIAVVNKEFADRFFGNQNPVGKTISFDDLENKDDSLEIVGVLPNLKWNNARGTAEPAVYRPILQVQDEAAYTATLQIRTNSNPLDLAPAVRAAIAQVDERTPIFGVTSLNDQVRETMNQDRLIAQLVSFFGALALLLASVGLYGVMAHNVTRRTNEIGIRMALGAGSKSILMMVLRETVLLVIGGLLIGVPAAFLATRLISSQLYGLSSGDPTTFIAAVIILIGVAITAGYLPARRASRVNPLIALRYE
ncbi:MAG TPA: ABC transporter permease [Pyrinomonadaceae bacterium]|jgi:predicted permease|nr:ABC transporter permease [Pyrinomonadaceae bacterium]